MWFGGPIPSKEIRRVVRFYVLHMRRFLHHRVRPGGPEKKPSEAEEIDDCPFSTTCCGDPLTIARLVHSRKPFDVFDGGPPHCSPIREV